MAAQHLASRFPIPWSAVTAVALTVALILRFGVHPVVAVVAGVVAFGLMLWFLRRQATRDREARGGLGRDQAG